jgi:segregation and condensation protein A
MSNFILKLENFEGPLNLLLQLINEEKLDITQISLAKITDTFLLYLEKIEETKPDELADFLVVAAKLLLIKSSLLLRTDQNLEEEVTDLVDQLKIYREYLLASKNLQKLINKKNFSYAKEKYPINLVQRNFKLNKKISPLILKENFENVLEIILSQIKLTQKRIKKIVSLKEKIEEIIKKLKEIEEINFNRLIRNSNKIEIIVTFLAILELAKKEILFVSQNKLFGEIIIKKI